MRRRDIARAIRDNPELNSTELAIKLAGGYTTKDYHPIIMTINDLKKGATMEAKKNLNNTQRKSIVEQEVEQDGMTKEQKDMLESLKSMKPEDAAHVACHLLCLFNIQRGKDSSFEMELRHENNLRVSFDIKVKLTGVEGA